MKIGIREIGGGILPSGGVLSNGRDEAEKATF